MYKILEPERKISYNFNFFYLSPDGVAFTWTVYYFSSDVYLLILFDFPFSLILYLSLFAMNRRW